MATTNNAGFKVDSALAEAIRALVNQLVVSGDLPAVVGNLSVANNLATNDPAVALSAAQGVILNSALVNLTTNLNTLSQATAQAVAVANTSAQTATDAQILANSADTKANLLLLAPIPLATSISLNSSLWGKKFEVTSGLAITVPTGLPNGFFCDFYLLAGGSVNFLSQGTQLNGATTTISRSSTGLDVCRLARLSTADRFLVTGGIVTASPPPAPAPSPTPTPPPPAPSTNVVLGVAAPAVADDAGVAVLTTNPINTVGGTNSVGDILVSGLLTATVSDNKGNTWTLVSTGTRADSSSLPYAWYRCVNFVGGNGHTFSLNNGGQYASIGFVESRSATPSTVANFIYDNATPFTASVTTPAAGALVLAFTSSVIDTPAGWTPVFGDTTGIESAGWPIHIYAKTSTGAGTESISITAPAGGSSNIVIAMSSLAYAAGSVAPTGPVAGVMPIAPVLTLTPSSVTTNSASVNINTTDTNSPYFKTYVRKQVDADVDASYVLMFGAKSALTTVPIPSLLPGTTYVARSQGVNASTTVGTDLYGPWSNYVTFTTITSAPPPTVDPSTPAISNGTVTLTWSGGSVTLTQDIGPDAYTVNSISYLGWTAANTEAHSYGTTAYMLTFGNDALILDISTHNVIYNGTVIATNLT